MKTVNSWSFRPYTEMHRTERGMKPYVCRIVPTDNSFSVDFFDNGASGASYTLYWRIRSTEAWTSVDAGKASDAGSVVEGVTVSGLTDLTDYEFYVEREDGAASQIRLVRTGFCPGQIINYLHPDDKEYAFSGSYLCSPSIIRLPSGRLLSSMDLFGYSTPQNLTLIYYSDDNAASWHYLTELMPCFWGKMFLHDGKLYMIGCSNEYGDLLIGRSDDDGATWTMPTVLWRGAANTGYCGLHRAPMPVEISHGRVMTDVQYGSWNQKTMTDAVLSAPEGCDLLDASNWVITPFWDPADHPEAQLPGVIGGIEGCVVTGPDNRVYDALRYAVDKWLLLEFFPDEPERELEFAGFMDIPTTQSKCNITRDPVTGKYVSIVSYSLKEPKTLRNLLSFVWSDDFYHWNLACHLIDYRYEDGGKIGFQYIDFFIEGDDILYQSRTAFNQAHNYHDANYACFHKIENFRELIKGEN